MALTIESAATVGIPSSIGSSGRPRSGIVIHYVGGNPISRGSHSTCRQQVRNWHSYHRTGNGWAGLGYHYTICHHGIVMTGRGLNRIGAHAPGANATHIGILIMLGGSQTPSADQLAGFRAFRAWLSGRGVRAGNVTPHSRWISTSCPGNHLRSRVANNNWGAGGTPGGPGGGGGVTRSVRSQQQAINGLGYTPKLVVDGIWGPKTGAGVKWLQRRVGANVDGDWGPETERKYTAYVEDDVPTYVSIDKSNKSRTDAVRDSNWRTVFFDVNHSSGSEDHHGDGDYPSLVRGPADYTGYISLRLTDLPKGVECQARIIEVAQQGGEWVTVERDDPVEFSGTNGDTFVKIPAAGYVNDDHRLRVEVTHFGGDDINPRVISGKARLQVWER